MQKLDIALLMHISMRKNLYCTSHTTHYKKLRSSLFVISREGICVDTSYFCLW